MSLKRPQATDTEDDLLALQESFLSHGSKPSAVLKKARVQGASGSASNRDVVRLSSKDVPHGRKSKFKEEREREKLVKKHEAMQKSHPEAMESQDTPIGQEIASAFVIPATVSRAQHGFPIVPVIDLSSLASEPPPKAADPDPWKPGGTRKRKKKRSLFAQQFGDKDLSFFGIESTPVNTDAPRGPLLIRKDVVEPVSVGGDSVEGEGEEEQSSHDMGQEAISGAGVDISNILSNLSVDEILQAKEEYEKKLGPDMVAFLKSRKKAQPSATSVPASKVGGASSPPVEKLEAAPVAADETGDTGVYKASQAGGQGGATEKDKPILGKHMVKVTPPGGWLHMDVLERDKLEWTTDVPVPAAPKPELDRTETRFSFDGLVIPRAVTSIPSHVGLHHHGNEPQAAGYTLSELILLCRSSVLQQRVLSLQTLSRIMRRAQWREYEQLVEESVMGRLCEAEVPLLLRYALDEGTEAVVMAAVQALHSLLVPPMDQELLAEYRLCYCGHELPALRPPSLPRKKKASEEEEEEETDSDILQRDVIEGYLGMSLLPRVRYLLEVFFPPERTNSRLQLLEILTRVAQHSTAAASKVVSCPRLMGVVFESFLPLSWAEGSEGGERPQLAAMVLVIALCRAGRSISSELISKHGLLSVIHCYTVIHPSEQNLPVDEASALATASLNAWQVLLSYGLGDEAFRDTFSVFLKQLQLLPSAPTLSALENRRISALLCLVGQVFPLAALDPSQLGVEGGGQLPPPAVHWRYAAVLFPPLLNTVGTWIRESSCSTRPDMDSLLSRGAILHAVASYLDSLRLKVGDECTVEVLGEVEKLVSNVVAALVESTYFSMTLEAISCDVEMAAGWLSPPSLPAHFTPPPPNPPQRALYTHMRQLEGVEAEGKEEEGPVTPTRTHTLLLRGSNLVLGLTRLCLSCVQLHRGVAEGVAVGVLGKKAFREYLASAVSGEGKLSPLSVLRVKSAYYSIKTFVALAEIRDDIIKDVNFFHAISFQLFAAVPQGLEQIARDLISNVIFHPLFYRKAPGLSLALDVYQRALDRLLRREASSIPLRRNSCLQPPAELVLPADWVFCPLISEYDKTLTEKTTCSADVMVKTLTFILLLEEEHHGVLSSLSQATKFARLMCIFFMGELFFEGKVRDLLERLLQLYCRDSVMTAMDLSLPIPGVLSFTDLFRDFVEHFASVSYGDHLFGMFVLLPLQQRFPIALRRLVWEDYPWVLRSLSVPLSKLPFDVNLFLYPIETDVGMIKRYLSCLASSDIRPNWSPLLYLVAIHHVHSFVFNSSSSSLLTSTQKELIMGILGIKNVAVQRDLLHYEGSSNTGLEISSEIKPHVRNFVEAATQQQN